MKRIIIAVIAIGMIAQVSFAAGLGIFGSYWDTKDADDEIGFGAKIKLDLTPQMALEVRGSYFEFDERIQGTRSTLEIIPVEAGLMYRLPTGNTSSFYFGGGAGYYLMDAEVRFADNNRENLDVDDEFGWFVAGGLEIPLAVNLGIFAEAKYTWLEMKRVEGLETDVKLDGFGANAGVIFKW